MTDVSELGRADATGSERSAAGAAAATFVRDDYFAPGHWGLKVRETLIALLLWIVLLYPIAVLVNSADPHARPWASLYRWTYRDGYALVEFLADAVTVIVVVVVACSVGLLRRNNRIEREVYPARATYDVAAQARRRAAIETMYDGRFGDEELRHTTRYYVVDPEQNLPTRLVHDLAFGPGAAQDTRRDRARTRW